MLEEGIGYNEEWQLGVLLDVATKRRQYRVKNGSTEGMVPNPVPSSTVSIYPDKNAPDNIGISVNVQISHNAANNKTANAATEQAKFSDLEEPVSSANLLVTECMILAGEAIGRWKTKSEEDSNPDNKLENALRLPFRTQKKPGA